MGRGATAALSIIGGILLFIAALVNMGQLRQRLVVGGIWDQYQDAVFFQFGMTVFLALVAIIVGGIAGTTTTNVSIRICGAILLIFGFVGLVGPFLPYEEIGPLSITITVSIDLIYFDPVLVMLAGVCGIATDQESHRGVYIPPPVQPQQVTPVYVIYAPPPVGAPAPPPAAPPASSHFEGGTFCTSCGAPNPPKAKFCRMCRAVLIPDE